MQAITIVTVVRALLEAGQDDQSIADTLDRMGFMVGGDSPDTEAEIEANPAAVMAEAQTAMQPPARQAPRRAFGVNPSVKYHMAGNWTAAKLADRLSGRKLQVASIVLANNKTGITKRQIMDVVAKQEPTVTNGAIMSALAGLGSGQLGIIKSVDIPNGKQPPKPHAGTVRRSLNR